MQYVSKSVSFIISCIIIFSIYVAYNQRKTLLVENLPMFTEPIPRIIPIPSRAARYESKYENLPFDMENTLRHIEKKLQRDLKVTK